MALDNDIRRLLVENFHPRAGRGAWHGGPSASGALRGVSAATASWRPAPGRKTIWELALHIAYWNYAVRRRIEGGAGDRFARSPANFPLQPEPADERAWAADRRLLDDEHERLRAAIAAVSPERYGQKPAGARKWTFGELIVGVAQHDAYHTGQIQLLKRLWAERGRLR